MKNIRITLSYYRFIFCTGARDVCSLERKPRQFLNPVCESCGLLRAYERQHRGVYVAYLPHFEQWVNRTTADIKRVKDTQPRLVGYHRRHGA